MPGKEVILGLVKFGRRPHIEDFKRGVLYMNPLSYFVDLEKTNQGAIVVRESSGPINRIK